MRQLLAGLLLPLAALSPLLGVESTQACEQPSRLSIEAAFDLAGDGDLPPSYPQAPLGSAERTVPPTLLKAVGWVESGWRQFTASGRPLVSSDFGYGIMQITSGMAGAFGDMRGSIGAGRQSRIATDYMYNIAYGATVLMQKLQATPRIGNADPTVLETWYYALWAYNGWGWINNPNNPRFTRTGTPATNPRTFPYQERVLYWVAHPPRDRDGNPLWPPVAVGLPSRKQVGRQPAPLPQPVTAHVQLPQALTALYGPAALQQALPGASQTVAVRLINAGSKLWPSAGTGAVSLVYHLLSLQSDPWAPISPFSSGVLAFGQGAVPLPHDLAPGKSVTVRTSLRAPSAPGTYRIAWDLQAGQDLWLSEAGVLPRVQTLHVVRKLSPATVPPLPSATLTPEPSISLQYVADTSVPDGSLIAPHQVFFKGWLVYNSGRQSWRPGWKLGLISGTAFGARSIPLPATRACHTANILVAMRAPARPGLYTGLWQGADAAGARFGERLTVKVRVGRAPPVGTPTPLPRPSPTARVKPTPTPTATPVG